jgi:NADH:ubiquinone oxidoreductase subunit 5 (subunit L)/multisubunit Na+/H+ antiporter MnhA subunit
MAFVTVLNLLLAAALLPLGGGLILRLWGRHMGRQGRAAGAVGMAVAVASFGLAAAAQMRWVDQGGLKQSNYVETVVYRWVALPPVTSRALPAATPPAPANPDPNPASTAATHGNAAQDVWNGLTIGCLIDSLTIATFLVVTLLNVLIHLFALGTADSQSDRGRFFAWLAWLNFALLGFLLANSPVQMLAFAELTSVAAFFLIRLSMPGETAARASLRMYRMNLMGTAACALGLGILVMHTHALGGLAFFDDRGNALLPEVVRQAADMPTADLLAASGGTGWFQVHWLTWAGLCFIVAALPRMAQFPFFTWLHEAAEAPAAAVALVTLAMSTVGAVLLARMYPILTLDARLILAIVGGVTLAAGVLAALAQSDLRGILAWLTVSQGGWVLLFFGAGGYEAGLLHLLAMGFVRTALFLTAGILLRGLGTTDIRPMGGLWKRFPITAFASLAAVLALGGAPWLSGAYATNLGLECVYDYTRALAVHGRGYPILLFVVPAVLTYLTALAIGRWWWLTFAGINRAPKLYEAAHESTFLTLPIILLAIFCAGRIYDFAGILPMIGNSVPPMLRPPGGPALAWIGSAEARILVLRFTGLAFLGLGAAAFMYLNGMGLAARWRRLPVVKGLEFWVQERFLFDDFCEGVILPGLRLAVRLVGWVERLCRMLGRLLSRLLRLLAETMARLDREVVGDAPSPPQDGGESGPSDRATS